MGCLVPNFGEVSLTLHDLSPLPSFAAEHRAFLSFCWRRFGCPLQAWKLLLGMDRPLGMEGELAAKQKIAKRSAFLQRCFGTYSQKAEVTLLIAMLIPLVRWTFSDFMI